MTLNDELGRYVAERLNGRLIALRGTRRDLASKITDETGLKKTTLVNDSSYIFGGSLRSWVGRSRRCAYKQTQLRKLRTLALFMEVLEIAPDDEIVGKIRAEYSDFVYPPANRV